MIKIKFYSFKCNIPYLNIFLNRILVDLDGDSGDFSGDSGDSGGDSGDSAVIPVIPGNRVTPQRPKNIEKSAFVDLQKYVQEFL